MSCMCAVRVLSGQQFYGRLNYLPRHPVYGLDLLTNAGETRDARVHSTFSGLAPDVPTHACTAHHSMAQQSLG